MRTERIPLTFDKGVVTYFEDSAVPTSAALVIQNWVPESDGSLRCRAGWNQGIATSAPATRRVRGIGRYPDLTNGKQLFVATDDNSANFVVYSHAQDLSSGAWTSRDTLAVADRTLPVAFAAGGGLILYSHPGFPSQRIRRWNGAAAADLSTAAVAGRALLYHANRLFSGGPTANRTRVYYSNVGDVTTFDTAYGYLEIGQDDGETIEDMAEFDRGVVIGKENSLWYLSGYGPDTFTLVQLEAGGVMPGRSLCRTPQGTVAVGRDKVWSYDGGVPKLISQPIERTFSLTGAYVTTAFLNGKVYIQDFGSAATWVYDVDNDLWFKESYGGQAPSGITRFDSALLMGTQAGTTEGPLNYRSHPSATRARDVGVAEAFQATTGDIWLASATTPSPYIPHRFVSSIMSPTMLHHVWLKIRQRGGTTGQAALTVTVTVDGVATVKTVPAKAAASVFRVRIDLGKPGYAVRIDFSSAQTTSDATMFDIEEITLEVDVEEPR